MEKDAVIGGYGGAYSEQGGTQSQVERTGGGFSMDTRYPRSIEGILRIITVVCRLAI